MSNRKHAVTAVSVVDGQWTAWCSNRKCGYVGHLGTGDDRFVSWVVAIHQGNHS